MYMDHAFKSMSIKELLSLCLLEGKESSIVSEITSRYDSPQRLYNVSIVELQEIKGIGPARAAQLKAILEIGRKLSTITNALPVIKSPSDAAELLMPDMRYLEKEVVKAVLLTTKNKVIKIETVAIGTIDSCLMHPREIFYKALKYCAAAVIVAHGHPSGDPAPSPEDIAITKRLMEASKIMGISLLDHLIIGDGVYYSFKEEGLI